MWPTKKLVGVIRGHSDPADQLIKLSREESIQNEDKFSQGRRIVVLGASKG